MRILRGPPSEWGWEPSPVMTTVIESIDPIWRRPGDHCGTSNDLGRRLNQHNGLRQAGCRPKGCAKMSNRARAAARGQGGARYTRQRCGGAAWRVFIVVSGFTSRSQTLEWDFQHRFSQRKPCTQLRMAPQARRRRRWRSSAAPRAPVDCHRACRQVVRPLPARATAHRGACIPIIRSCLRTSGTDRRR